MNSNLQKFKATKNHESLEWYQYESMWCFRRDCNFDQNLKLDSSAAWGQHRDLQPAIRDLRGMRVDVVQLFFSGFLTVIGIISLCQ